MHKENLNLWQHRHDFSVNNKKGERRTLYVLVLTTVTMIVEIVAGSIFGSMALLADGWHMGTHVAAFLIAVAAYRFARRHEKDEKFAFGTGKVNVLGGFASAVALAVVALFMIVESIQRIFEPHLIQFDEAIIVAFLGLLVNVISAVILKDRHGHESGHGHDHNLKAAYFHVLADALTSLLAILALFFGKLFGWNWFDPVMGIVGAMIISYWSFGLLKNTSPILLDSGVDLDYKEKIKMLIENDRDNIVSDLHIWRVGPSDYAAIIALVTHNPKPVEHYKALLSGLDKISHVTVEVNECRDE